MNRINRLFQQKPGHILSIYFTAGYPLTGSTVPVITALAASGVDMIEIGMPFSDPMADGPIIQASSTKALKNGMSLKLLFDQLRNIRNLVDIPLLLMGYLNPVIQYGMERFCSDCEETGIDGAILPDLPLEVYLDDSGLLADNNHNLPGLHHLYLRHNLQNIFLISPQTGTERIRKIDEISKGFVYLVSSSSITGIKGDFSSDQIHYFERLKGMELKNPSLIGFGISNHKSYSTACEYARGVIIGSAFVKMLGEGYGEERIREFVKRIRGK